MAIAFLTAHLKAMSEVGVAASLLRMPVENHDSLEMAKPQNPSI